MPGRNILNSFLMTQDGKAQHQDFHPQLYLCLLKLTLIVTSCFDCFKKLNLRSALFALLLSSKNLEKLGTPLRSFYYILLSISLIVSGHWIE